MKESCNIEERFHQPSKKVGKGDKQEERIRFLIQCQLLKFSAF